MRDVAKCPCCLEWVSSAGIVDHAQVECPLCGSHYSADQLLGMEPPPLRILPSFTPTGSALSTDDAATAKMPTIGPQVVDHHSVTPLELPKPIRPIAEPTVRPPLVVEPAGPEEGVRVPSPFVGQPRAKTSSVAHRWHTRRRRSRPFVELIKIVLGGLAGVVIAQLILWWLPGDLRRDPFDLAPRLPVWLQWLRPNELGVLRRPAAIRDAGAASAAIREDPFVDEAPVTSALRLPIDDPSRPGARGNRSDDRPLPALVASVGAGIESPARVAGLPDAPVYTGAELQQALAHVLTSLDAVRTIPNDSESERRNQQRLLYQRLCDVAQMVTFVDVNDPQIGRRMKAVEALTTRIAREPPLRHLVAQAAVSWLSFTSRTSNGIVVVGEVTQIRQTGKWFETELQLQDKSSARICVLSIGHPMQDPREPYDTGQRLVLLGSILPRTDSWPPAAEAARDRWIWRGFHTVCPP